MFEIQQVIYFYNEILFIPLKIQKLASTYSQLLHYVYTYNSSLWYRNVLSK